MKAAAEKSRSATVLDLQARTYYNLVLDYQLGEPTITNSECLIGISDAFSAFVYGYPSSCPRAHCTPNKSVTTLRYTRRLGPVYIQAMPVGTYRVQSPGFPKIVYCEGQSHKTVHRPQLLKRKESRGGIEPRSFCLPT